MRTITATEASRRFSDLLDAIDRGETVIVTRGNRPIAELRPAHSRTGRDLREALSRIPPPDERFEADIADALSLIRNDIVGLDGDGVTDGGVNDPWAES